MLPLHIKKTNNTNKLMQISYHSALTKIQKKKKLFFCTSQYCPKLAGMTGTWLVRPVFKPVRNVDVTVSVYIPV